MMPREPILKAHAYVTRTNPRAALADDVPAAELLVFNFADDPDGRPQIPGGGVERGESPEHAVIRELFEESGLTTVRIERLLEIFERAPGDPDVREPQLRHAFHLTLTAPAPDTWRHTVIGGGEDHGDVFVYRWIPLAEAEKRLWPVQSRPIRLLRATLAEAH